MVKLNDLFPFRCLGAGNLDAKLAELRLGSGDGLAAFLSENPREAEAIIAKCFLSAQARIAARTVRASILRKGALT